MRKFEKKEKKREKSQMLLASIQSCVLIKHKIRSPPVDWAVFMFIIRNFHSRLKLFQSQKPWLSDAIRRWSGILLNPIEIGSDTGVDRRLIGCTGNPIADNPYMEYDVVFEIKQRSSCQKEIPVRFQNWPLCNQGFQSISLLPESPWHVSLLFPNEHIWSAVQLP